VTEAEPAPDLILRLMELKDVEQVYAIDVQSFSLPWSERSYRFELTENPTSRPWVAELVNARGQLQVVGMIVVWIILDEAHIATIATHPAFRRRGIARRLLVKALEDAASQGAIKAYLEVRRSNLGAQKLYEQFGFFVTGVRPRYYLDTQEDALLMTLERLDLWLDHYRPSGEP
jgi:ribosomal-protein-alanine N-acetyltransferase